MAQLPLLVLASAVVLTSTQRTSQTTFVTSPSSLAGCRRCGKGGTLAVRRQVFRMREDSSTDDLVAKAVAAGMICLQLMGTPTALALGEPAKPPLTSEAPSSEQSDEKWWWLGSRKRAGSAEGDMVDEVEELERQEEVEKELKQQSKRRPAPRTKALRKGRKGQESPRIEAEEVPAPALAHSVETVQGLAPYLDEVEYLITARKWDYLKGFLGVFASCEQDFVELIEGMFPSSRPAAVSARDAMQLEAQNIYLAVDDLYQSAMNKKVKGAEKAYVKLALAYDRFIKAGNIIKNYDPVTSTEQFFKDIPDEMLRYERDSKVPLEVRDEILILKGPDKGRTGRIVGVIKSRNEGIVRIDGQAREMRILELSDIARQLPDTSPMPRPTRSARK